MMIELTYSEVLEAIETYINNQYPCHIDLERDRDHGVNVTVNAGSKYVDFCELDSIQIRLA